MALNLPIQEDSKAQQIQKSSQPNISMQRQRRGQTPQRTPGNDSGIPNSGSIKSETITKLFDRFINRRVELWMTSKLPPL